MTAPSARRRLSCSSLTQSSPTSRLTGRALYEISSVLDAGTVYSNIPEKMESLRLYKKGFLKTLPVFSEFNMRDLLPLKVSSYTAIDANADTCSE